MPELKPMTKYIRIDNTGIEHRDLGATDQCVLLFPRDPQGALMHIVSGRVDMMVKFQPWDLSPEGIT